MTDLEEPEKSACAEEASPSGQGTLRDGDHRPQHDLHGNPPIRPYFLRHELGRKLRNQERQPKDTVAVVVISSCPRVSIKFSPSLASVGLHPRYLPLVSSPRSSSMLSETACARFPRSTWREKNMTHWRAIMFCPC